VQLPISVLLAVKNLVINFAQGTHICALLTTNAITVPSYVLALRSRYVHTGPPSIDRESGSLLFTG